MKIRSKIILVVLPIIIASTVLVGVASYFAATSGLNRIARSFLTFKSSELDRYAQGQWSLLVENGYTQKPEFIEAIKQSIGVYAGSLALTPSEAIFSLDSKGNLVQSNIPISLDTKEGLRVIEAINAETPGLLSIETQGERRVARGFYFAPLDWYIIISDTNKSFYEATDQITFRTGIILILSLLLAGLLLFWLAGNLSRPIRNVATTMRQIIESGDLSKTVEVEYPDETGILAHTFNIMTAELDKAQKQIKSFAYQAVLAQKSESKIRNIFQKFVPQEVIDQIYENPDKMLVGADHTLAILFSDIRSFTTISESMTPSDLVSSLNLYFSYMVDTIVNRKGTIDKYIGDAIMAFFGAPVNHKDDALQSVLAAIEMSEKVKIFNQQQVARGKPPFNIGIGINYGPVTVGNIGTDKKMDYTVIGDNVNLASRLEGLTKEYHSEIVISELLWNEVKEKVNWRLLDAVKVKGKTKGVKIFGIQGTLSPAEFQGWNIHNQAMEEYFAKRFTQALGLFQKAKEYLPGDPNLEEMIDRCQDYQLHQPPADWDGAKVMKTK